MAQNDIILSALDAAASLPAGTLFYVAVEDQQSESGYSSLKIGSELLISQMLSVYNFPLLFDTTSKNTVGAINELAARPTYKDVTGTLEAGETSITISDAAITTTSTIDIYADVFGLTPDSVSVSSGSITLVFPEQADDVLIKVRVS